MFKKFLIFILVNLAILSGAYVGVKYAQKTNSKVLQNNSTIINNASTLDNVNNDEDTNFEENTVQNAVIDKVIQEEETSEIFGEHYEKAEELMEDMTIEEKVGQMFLARYPENGNAIEEIKSHNPGGYVLFGWHFDNKTPETIQKELQDNQDASKINLIFGVDEEGGSVVRVSNHKAFRESKFLSPQKLWSEGKLPRILEDSKEKSEFLKNLGLNMNLTPVVDVPQNEASFMYPRSYGRGVENTATYTARVVETMNNSNMVSVMKHFPGYGDNVDTHIGIAIDNRLYETFQNIDFIPFKKGIEAGAPCILVSHNIVKCIDENKPASLSENTVKILREELGFSGIIMTDDLGMDAVKTYVENGEAAVQAVLSGNDIIISSDFVKQKEEVLSAVKKGVISEEVIDTAVRRILAFKYRYEII